MSRSFVGVVVALLAWFVAATLGNLVLRVALPGYTQVEVAMTFTLAMLIARLVLGLVSSLAAGFVCAAIAPAGSPAAKVTAGLLVALFLPVHYGLWARFPIWYHLFFLGSLAPMVLLGAALQPILVGRQATATP
ncbi:MAG TPA: hypothetical protein VGQ91_09315 [Ideonella sp.]|jgi:hypothetical protein|nr:hypothetical protein [Ideonella sp.]